MSTVTNPILPGCYPDPSVCRVGDYYYLVCSTFEMWPGLPIFRSNDLIRWEPVGYAIDRASQMSFEGVKSSHGLFAPTIRHHHGTFYIVCTRVGAPGAAHHGNFLITTEDPAGDWSDPIWLVDEAARPVDGIDPSIFFDDDGRVWLHGTRPALDPEWEGQTEVWLREYDPARGVVDDTEHILWTGAVRGAVWAEGPHIFRHQGRYYLVAAEGGTEFHHAVCLARADHVTGPYVGNKANPVLTHRHLGHPRHGSGPDIVGVGHADLVEAGDGSWWAALLAMRPYGGYHYNLGRETFLVPVVWQDGWPVFAPGEGQVPQQVHVPFADAESALIPPRDVVAGPVLPDDSRWTSLRGPREAFAVPQDGGFQIRVGSASLTERTTPSFLGVRQQHTSLDFTADLDLTGLDPGEAAGLVVRQSEEHHATVTLGRDDHGRWSSGARLVQNGVETPLANTSLTDDDATSLSQVMLGLRIREQDYHLLVNGTVVAHLDGRLLDTVTTGGFLGLWLGVFATSHGEATDSMVTLRTATYTPVI